MIKIFIVLVLSGILLSIIVICFFKRSTPTGLTELSVIAIDVDESNNKVSLKGALNSSGKSYYDYSYRFQDNALYITIKSGIITSKHNSGSFEITIEDSRISDTHTIYFESGNDVKAIYPE